MKKNSLKGYGQTYRSGMTMKQKWTTDKVIRQDKREMEKDRLNASLGKAAMGRNE